VHERPVYNEGGSLWDARARPVEPTGWNRPTIARQRYGQGVPEWVSLRAEFPLIDRYVYLNACSLGPLPRAGQAALEDYAGAWMEKGTPAWYSDWLPGFGAVVMRRRSDAPNWVRADTFRAGGGSSAGLQSRVFEAEDFLQALRDDTKLLDQRLALVPEHRLEQSLRSRDGVWQQEDVKLTLTQGISFTAGLDRATAQVLQELDGRRTLRQSVAAAGRELGLPPRDVASLTETGVGMARRLYQLGFLIRSESPRVGKTA
jgi:hypothetical protein